jgi:hypothetical protein
VPGKGRPTGDHTARHSPRTAAPSRGTGVLESLTGGLQRRSTITAEGKWGTSRSRRFTSSRTDTSAHTERRRYSHRLAPKERIRLTVSSGGPMGLGRGTQSSSLPF